MERQLCSSLNHAGTKYPAGQSSGAKERNPAAAQGIIASL
jgi:hypothetical protein